MSKLTTTKRRQVYFEGERLRLIREANGLLQAEVADRIGITRTQVVNLERGNTEASINVLMRICEQFEVSADWLLGLSDTDPSWLEYEERVIRVAKVVPTRARQPDSEGGAE